jgi:hypothetical protein
MITITVVLVVSIAFFCLLIVLADVNDKMGDIVKKRRH